jgi:hypothetical protein
MYQVIRFGTNEHLEAIPKIPKDRLTRLCHVAIELFKKSETRFND